MQNYVKSRGFEIATKNRNIDLLPQVQVKQDLGVLRIEHLRNKNKSILAQ